MSLSLPFHNMSLMLYLPQHVLIVVLSLTFFLTFSDVVDLDSSMVIRDLTLRSAASFGSFHLIRLLYDEYMFYLVEHKVAAATGETSIAVMGKVRQVSFSSFPHLHLLVLSEWLLLVS